MRSLFQKYGRPPGLPEDGVEKTALELIGDPSLRDWFQRSVHSTEELQLDEALEAVGLKAVIAAAKSSEDKGSAKADPDDAPDGEARARGWLGASLKDKGGALEIATVADGSPAQAVGVAAGDEVVALDGFRSDLKQRLGRAQPGQMVRLSLFRMDELIELPVQLAATPRDTVTFVPDPAASPEQLAARQGWLGAPWPEE